MVARAPSPTLGSNGVRDRVRVRVRVRDRVRARVRRSSLK